MDGGQDTLNLTTQTQQLTTDQIHTQDLVENEKMQQFQARPSKIERILKSKEQQPFRHYNEAKMESNLGNRRIGN